MRDLDQAGRLREGRGRIWTWLKRGRGAGLSAAIPMPLPRHHYPDLASATDPGLEVLADCARCGARLFKGAGGTWKPLRAGSPECATGKGQAGWLARLFHW